VKPVTVAGASLLFAALGCFASPASAQEDPAGRGVVGGALVGAELVVLGEALFGVEPTWAYLVGGAVGAGAGAYAGHVVEEQAKREVSIILLAAGVALIIPTLVWVGNARQPTPPPTESVRLLPPRVSVAVDARRQPNVSLDLLRAQF
jgi:hypothetical protein